MYYDFRKCCYMFYVHGPPAKGVFNCLSLKECEGCEFVAPNNWRYVRPIATCDQYKALQPRVCGIITNESMMKVAHQHNISEATSTSCGMMKTRVWGRKIQHYCLWRISVNDYGKVEILSLAGMMQTSLMLRGDDQLLESRGRGADQGSDHGGGPSDRGPVRGLLLRTLRRHQRGHYRASATRAR